MEFSNESEIVDRLKNEVSHVLAGSEHHLATFRQRVASSKSPVEGLVLCDVLSQCVPAIANKPSCFLPALNTFEQVSWLRDGEESSDALRTAFCQLLVNLVCANGCFLGPCINVFVRNFSTLPLYKNAREIGSLEPTASGDRLHNSIKGILKVVPLGVQALLPTLIERFPHKALKLSHQENYLSHLLYICEYVPLIVSRLLTLVIEKMILLDVEIKLDDAFSGDEDDGDKSDEEGAVFDMDEDDSDSKEMHVDNKKTLMVDQTAEKLDVQLHILLTFLGKGNNLSEKTFAVLQDVFDRSILNTHHSKYVQFLLFWACNKDAEHTNTFLQRLVGKLNDTSLPVFLRQSCSAYVASFVSRAEYLKFPYVHNTLYYLLSIAVGYNKYGNNSPRARIPGRAQGKVVQNKMFYSLCQSAFYIIVFRGCDSQGNDGELRQLRALPWLDVLRSGLDPLKFCLDSVCREFIRVARELKLVNLAWLNHTERRLQSMSNLRINTNVVSESRSGSPSTPMRRKKKRARLSNDGKDEATSKKLTYVQCFSCGKWRVIPAQDKREDVEWTCSMNKLVAPQLANCNVPEEAMSQYHPNSVSESEQNEQYSALATVENPLDSFFPFDPCLLRRTAHHLRGLYRHWGDTQKETDGKLNEGDISVNTRADRKKVVPHMNQETDASPIPIPARERLKSHDPYGWDDPFGTSSPLDGEGDPLPSSDWNETNGVLGSNRLALYRKRALSQNSSNAGSW